MSMKGRINKTGSQSNRLCKRCGEKTVGHAVLCVPCKNAKKNKQQEWKR